MAQQERVARSKYDQKVLQDQEDEQERFELQQAKERQREEERQRRERERRQAVQDAAIEQADRDAYEDARLDLYQEFPEERSIIDGTMRGYRADWRQFQRQLRTQLENARYDREQRVLEFERQLQREIGERAIAEQEEGFTPLPQVIWAKMTFHAGRDNQIASRAAAPVATPTPTPRIYTEPGTRFGSQSEAIAGWRGRRLAPPPPTIAQEYLDDPYYYGGSGDE